MKGETEKKQYGMVENLLYGLRQITEVSKGFVWLFFAEIPLGIAISLLSAYLPSMLVEDITNASNGQTIAGVIFDLTLVIGGLTLLYLLQRWIKSTQEKKEKTVRYALSQKLSSASMKTSYANVESSEYQNLFSEITSNMTWSDMYTSNLLHQVVAVITAVIGMILYTGMLSGVSVWILLIVIAGTVLNLSVGMLSNKMRKKYEKRTWKLDHETAYLTKTISSYQHSKDIHLYHLTPWLTKLHDKNLKERLHLTVVVQAYYYMESSAGLLAQLFYEGFAYIYLIYCVCDGKMDAASFVFYIGIVKGFASWCSSIVGNVKELHNSSLNLGYERDLWNILNRGVKGGEQELVVAAGHVPEITFKNVTFQYESANEPTIVDLNLTIKAGENIALVGQNGSGKSTFIKLLCRMYDPQEGQILLNGVDIREYNYDEYLKLFSTVFQDFSLFAFQLGDNVSASDSYEEEAVKKALENAGFGERLQTLKKGVKTELFSFFNEDGVELSGGEQQKVAVARCLYKNAPYAILDEPTSALDPIAEADLYQRMNEFVEEKGAIYISHRLSSCHFCDRVLVFCEGKLIQEGTHTTLVHQTGLYKRMWDAQAKYYQKA